MIPIKTVWLHGTDKSIYEVDCGEYCIYVDRHLFDSYSYTQPGTTREIMYSFLKKLGYFKNHNK